MTSLVNEDLQKRENTEKNKINDKSEIKKSLKNDEDNINKENYFSENENQKEKNIDDSRNLLNQMESNSDEINQNNILNDLENKKNDSLNENYTDSEEDLNDVRNSGYEGSNILDVIETPNDQEENQQNNFNDSNDNNFDQKENTNKSSEKDSIRDSDDLYNENDDEEYDDNDDISTNKLQDKLKNLFSILNSDDLDFE